VSGTPVDLQADGVLYMINKTLFHPRGYALAITEEGAFELWYDGSEPMSFDLGPLEDDLFNSFNALLEKTSVENIKDATESDSQ